MSAFARAVARLGAARLAAAASAMAALLLPKCPLCVAAYLAWLGLGAGLAGVLALLLRPALVGVCMLMVALGVWRWRARSLQTGRAAKGRLGWPSLFREP